MKLKKWWRKIKNGKIIEEDRIEGFESKKRGRKEEIIIGEKGEKSDKKDEGRKRSRRNGERRLRWKKEREVWRKLNEKNGRKGLWSIKNEIRKFK